MRLIDALARHRDAVGGRSVGGDNRDWHAVSQDRPCWSGSGEPSSDTLRLLPTPSTPRRHYSFSINNGRACIPDDWKPVPFCQSGPLAYHVTDASFSDQLADQTWNTVCKYMRQGSTTLPSWFHLIPDSVQHTHLIYLAQLQYAAAFLTTTTFPATNPEVIRRIWQESCLALSDWPELGSVGRTAVSLLQSVSNTLGLTNTVSLRCWLMKTLSTTG